jgi:hypothetical protein
MRMIFDFQCTSASCGKVFEDLVDSEVHELPCPACTENSVRLISAPHIDWRKMGLDPAFPSASDKWAKEITNHHKTDKGSMHNGKAPNLSMY